jgi:gas vesicle protein
MDEERGTYGGMMIAFLAGGLIGAGLALLLAPVTGTEARKKIGDLAGDIKKKAEGWSEDLKKKAESVIDMEKRKAKGTSESFQDVMEGPA